MNRGYLRKKLKWEAKRLLPGRLSFCLTMLLLWGVLWYFTSWLSGSFGLTLPPMPELTSDPAVFDAYILDCIAAWRSIAPVQLLGMGLTAMLGFLLRAPLDAGIAANYLALSTGGETPRVKNTFAYYIGPGLLSRVLLTELLRLFWETLWLLPGLAAAVATLMVTDLYLGFALSLLSMALMVLGYVRIGAYAQTRYLLAARPDLSPRGIVRLSAQNMRGRLWDYALFQLSFLPWIILAAVTMMLSMIYFLPYYQMCMALYMRRTWPQPE